MSTAAVDTNAVQDTPFDAPAYMKQRDAEEAAKRKGEAPPPPKPVKVETKPTEDEPKNEDEQALQHAKLPRSVRRELNRLREDVGIEKGRRMALEALIGKEGAAAVLESERSVAPPAKAVEAEPTREQFSTDAEYNRAIGRWEARQEVAKLEKKLATDEEVAATYAKFEEEMTAANTASQAEYQELFPDWAAVQKANAENEDAPKFRWADHEQLSVMVATSPVQHRLIYFWMTHPADFQILLDLSKADATKQIKEFHRLEGRVEKMYSKPEKKEVKKLTPAEHDAKLPRPSESVEVRGGTSAAGDIPMLLEGGRLNPAWEAKRNAEEGRRR